MQDQTILECTGHSRMRTDEQKTLCHKGNSLLVMCYENENISGEFHFLEDHGRMNLMGLVQSQRTLWVQFKVNEPYGFSSKSTNLMGSVQS